MPFDVMKVIKFIKMRPATFCLKKVKIYMEITISHCITLLRTEAHTRLRKTSDSLTKRGPLFSVLKKVAEAIFRVSKQSDL